jgi:catechol 2,3-dioxygenase-like lactoylglutathione lyase family enzyme
MMALTAPVSRTTVFTRDAERSLGFYCDLLGMEVWIDNVIPNPGASDILGQPCESMRIIVLRAADTAIGNIGLAEVHGANPPLDNPPPATKVQFGEPCLVIRTEHLKELLPMLDAAGVHVISPPTKLDLPIEDEVWEMFLRDPDGTMINLSHHGAW